MEELIKEIQESIKITFDRIGQMQESNRARKSRGERPYYDEFDIGKAQGYKNGLDHALQIIKQHIEKTKPTEPATETGSNESIHN